MLVLADGSAVATASASRPGRKLLGMRLLLQRGHGTFAPDAEAAAAAAAAAAAEADGSAGSSGSVRVSVLIRTRFGD